MTLTAAAVEPDDVRSARTIFGASVTGASHVRRGTPCQDAFCVVERDGAFAIAVADGLGTAVHSRVGAWVATQAAAAGALRSMDDGADEAAFDAMVAARGALRLYADITSVRLRDLACTLLVAAGDAEHIGVAHIGDGAIVGRRSDEWLVVSPPGDSEYLNETDPLTARDWDRRVRWVSALEGVDALALFTDGCQHAVVRRDDGVLRAHAGFLRPLFDYAASGIDPSAASAELGALLEGRKLSEHSDDDKTLVLALL